ncbi:lactonase family protein [Botrimarina colliarenosi]|uniref:lactonase family protein n=1 Tax=Botrimarina colliarenosi TaxID=2528001 RepID=UPI001E30BE1C|nr:lactonase family protein [Botrimarina colliarenosi]
MTLLLAATTASAATHDLWIGTDTGPERMSQGIYHLTFDDEKGTLSPAKLAAEASQPGFLAKHPTLPVLYATVDADGGAVAAWRIVEGNDGKRLQPMGSVPTGDGGPCYVSVDYTGRVLLSAQYGGGSVASYLLKEDGSIAERVSLLEHDDPSGVVPDRQAACHAHWAGVSPNNRYVLSPDLGADRVYVHALDAANGVLTPHGSVKTPPGGGARHFAFHPSGTEGYVVNELAMSVSALGWDGDKGELTLLGTFETLRTDQIEGEVFNSGSEVRVHPSGKFAYVGNRGHDSISAYRVSDDRASLTLVDQEPVRGSHPRNFAIDPSGKWLIAAGRDSNTLAVFAIDQETGELQWTLHSVYAPAPICVLFP